MDTGRTISIEDIFHDGSGGSIESPHAAAISARKAQQGGKAEGAFRTISEVADSLGVPQHVLRFWETKFTQIKPLKRGGGRRYYRPEDVALLQKIHALLYTEGYTIRGVQKLLRGQGRQQAAVAAAAPVLSPAASHVGGEESATPSADEVLAAILPQITREAEEAFVVPEKKTAGGGLSAHQRRLMEGLLEDLRSLRALVAAAEGGAKVSLSAGERSRA